MSQFNVMTPHESVAGLLKEPGDTETPRGGRHVHIPNSAINIQTKEQSPIVRV